MTCTEFRNRFPDYAAGRVSETTAAALEAHLEECAACEAVLANEVPPIQELRSLPRSIDPAEDLWLRISERMTRRRGLRARVALPRWGLAAAALLVVALSSSLTLALSRRESAVARVDVSSGVEGEYAAASQDLLAALDSARARISPEALATIERNLHIIDAALAESRDALARDPGNAALFQLVVGTWRQKLDLLRRATEMSKAT